MIIPLSPILARDFGADGLEVGLLISIYSLIQFLSAPLWGRLSDIFGRKSILLIGLLGMSLAHFWFAFSNTLFQLFASRAIAGFFGGNIAIGTAYISDVTQSENRTKNLGLIGMAFGLGFTIGPVLGGLFLFLGQSLGSAPPFGMSFASLMAGVLSILNFVSTFVFLKESHPRQKTNISSEPQKHSRPSLKFIRESLSQPVLGNIFFLSFILWFVLAQIEPTLILLVRDDFSWTREAAYWGFAYIGLLMAFSQGFLVRRFIPKFGERYTNLAGLFFVSLGLILMGISLLGDQVLFSFSNHKITSGLCILALSVTLFSIGHSLSSTSISGALSILSSRKEQGQVFGVNQSLSALARILGPVFGGWLYRDLSHMSPFLIAGAFSFGSFFLSYRTRKSFPNLGQIPYHKKEKEVSVNSQDTDNFSLYSLDQMQFSNLIQKRIGFCLISVGAFEPEAYQGLLVKDKEGVDSPLLSYLFMKLNLSPSTLHNITLRKVTSENSKDSLSFLKSLSQDQAMVFVCEKGDFSRSFSNKIRTQGYFNAYYLGSGWKNI